MKKQMVIALCIMVIFAVSSISPVIAGESSGLKEDAWYTFRLNPFSDVIHMYTNPGGWLNGYNEAYTYPSGAILGKYENGYAYIACDLPAGGIEMFLIVINIKTRDGWMYRIKDDWSLIGPDYVWLTTTGISQSNEGPTTDDVGAQGSAVTPQAWYYFHINPWINNYWISTDRMPWLWGYDDDDGDPILGYATGGRFYFATDFWDGTAAYELTFKAGKISTRDGYSQRTYDGYSYVLDYFWLTT